MSRVKSMHLLTQLLDLPRTQNDEQVDAHRLLLIFWRVSIVGMILNCIETSHDNWFTLAGQSIVDTAHGFTAFMRLHRAQQVLIWATILGTSFTQLPIRWLLSLSAIGTAWFEFSTAYWSGANHFHLITYMVIATSAGLLLISFLQKNAAETSEINLAAWSTILFVRWFVVFFMLWTGINKLLYGTYFRGQYLAALAARPGSFHSFYRFVLTEAEMEAISDSPFGPFRFQSWLAIAAANVVYVSEIAAGLMLLIPRFAVWGASATLLILVGIEAAARELVFGTIMLQAVVSYFPKFFLKRGWQMCVFAYALVALYFILRLLDSIADLDIT
ncbi:hypothetical protein [Rubinisphaera brasiliensis]|nr:hypothetical protein [Rubinisphaera brasiliensis]